MTPAVSNRRMRKTACPVVWKGHGAKAPCPHPMIRGCGLDGLVFTETRFRAARNDAFHPNGGRHAVAAAVVFVANA